MAVVVSHIADDFDCLAAQVLRQAPLADLVELRLDRIGNPGQAALEELVRACPKPVIVAVHGAEAFGGFAGPTAERLDILRTAARAGARFVDVDWRLSLELGEVSGKCHRIVSRHELDGTPADLAELHEEVRAVLYEGDVVKLVAHAGCCEDGLRMLSYVRAAGGGLIGFCSGAAGAFTRLLAPIFGSPFTYAAAADVPGAEAGPETAPGQIRVNALRAMMPPGGLSAETAIFGVVGANARYSWSPRVQGMALKAARLDAVYVAFEPDDFDAFLDLAGDESLRGLSITAPFKQDALRRSSSIDGDARAAAAVNTLVRERAGWRGFNTDVGAIAETLARALRVHERDAGRPARLADAHTLVLGTGGAARAAAQAVRAAGGRLTVAGRDRAKATLLAREFKGAGVGWEEAPAVAHDVLVHCTPLGSAWRPGELPFPAEALRPGTVVLDAVYRPVRTPLLAAAVARGCTAVPGGEWFVRQALAQFRLFTGQEADEALLRAAFEHALEDER